ncbi:MAG: AAA family ATPase [Defluviitaleaceae bacterium]|nr:AAA family ATPase [Defluviitaleaceae bacterium]
MELKWNQLKYFCDKLSDTEECIETSNPPGLIGQKRAAEALNLGLIMKHKGYNIYITGQPGEGRTSFAKNFAEKKAKQEAAPPDLMYVYNFQNPKCPKLLQMPAGMGRTLQEQMNELLDRLINELPKSFTNRDFEAKKNDIVKMFQQQRDEIISEMTEEAKKQEFGVKNTNSGIYFMPIIDGVVIDEDQYDELTQEQRDSISKNSESIQKRAAEVMRQIKDIEKNTRKEVEDLEYSIGLFTVGHHINSVMQEYEDHPLVIEYLKAVKEDILDNLEDFIAEEQEEEDPISAYLPWSTKKNADENFTKYKINLLTSHDSDSGAPVVVDFNPTYTNLVGEVEYDNEYGNFSTDFMKIKPGLLHKANGGYLILQAQDILTNHHAWEALRRTLLTGKIVTEPLREYSTGVAVSSVKPEPIPIDVKIIIIGSSWYYSLLYDFDDQFEKLFRIRVDFDYEMKLNNEHLKDITAFVRCFAKEANVSEIEPAAICRLIEYASRLAERQDRLTTCFHKLAEIIHEAAAWAQQDDSAKVTDYYITKAIQKRMYRLNMYEEKLSEMIEDGTIMIDTDGEKVGQINGLAVIDINDYAFAKPSRITATTYMGKAGIVNIEKEAEMSGRIHDKGVQVMIGYLGKTYAQEFPLSLSCRIGFEQNYSGIDGDSASSTELYAVLSSLSGLPIRQNIAVTGSINQHGEIQPIGGATYKIEGFFDLCNKRGLTGEQGVIIPKQNIRDLVLNDDVIEAVREGKFHIYAIGHVNEGISILTGVLAGEADAHGRYPIDSVHGKVLKRLKTYHKRALKSDGSE